MYNNCNIFYKNNFNNFIKESNFILSKLPNSIKTLNLVKKIQNSEYKNWIDLSISNSLDVFKINKILAKQNISYLDSPISDNSKKIKKKNIYSITSGPKNVYDECYDIINTYSDNIYYISEKVGVSNNVILANNILLAANLLSVAEVSKFLEQDKININEALKFINTSSGKSYASMELYPKYILNNNFNYGFSYDLHKKDIIKFLGKRSHLDLNDTYLLKQIFNIYINENNKIHDDMDHIEIVKIIK